MRNPLTAALLAMAIHALVGLVFRWPYPSVATFVTGVLAVAGAASAPRAPRTVSGGLAALTLFLPSVIPLPLVFAGLAAILGPFLAPAGGPLRNAAVALPALTLLTVAITL